MDRPPLLKVRTITTGITLERGKVSEWIGQIEAAALFNRAAEAAFAAEGFEVQTTRICTNSFEEYVDDVLDREGVLKTFRAIDAVLQREEVGLFSAGPAKSVEGTDVIADVVMLGGRISASGAVLGPTDRAGCTAIARAVKRIACGTEGGEGNFQFCGAFNVPPGVPFFPAAFHEGPASFALGCETAAILDDAMPRSQGDMDLAGRLITESFEAQMAPLETIALRLSEAHDLPYAGIDASVAPLPSAPPLSASFESIGLGMFGESGTLAVAAIVTGALKAIKRVKICGYSGLMLPPLEDTGLAERASEQKYRIHDLLMYSAVCGLGLDTVPVPGDIPESKLAAIYLDVAALAFRLNKPLSARLFPVPGLVAGDETDFQNPCLCNSRVFEVP